MIRAKGKQVFVRLRLPHEDTMLLTAVPWFPDTTKNNCFRTSSHTTRDVHKSGTSTPHHSPGLTTIAYTSPSQDPHILAPCPPDPCKETGKRYRHLSPSNPSRVLHRFRSHFLDHGPSLVSLSLTSICQLHCPIAKSISARPKSHLHSDPVHLVPVQPDSDIVNRRSIIFLVLIQTRVYLLEMPMVMMGMISCHIIMTAVYI
ncbi:hypothetical protein NDU88_006472 [Pleurodeles waltl]|uniref:Uncharacterized protein n=1 Tax=Pleurodeles waltl TaxID=8319 RepID=A0AAV7SPQ7_PLEWA|nr:hypothetical protein NDU88_006472 [Pleurodeles waltl]